MNKQLKEQLKDTFQPPPSQNKSQFIHNLHYPKATRTSVYITQAGYISKRLWVLSAMIMMVIFVIASKEMFLTTTIKAISGVLPFLSLLGIIEIQKSRAYHMVELEMSCPFNFGKITLIRMAIIGTYSFLFVLMVTLCTNQINQSFLTYFIYLSVPFMVSSYLSIWIINRFSRKDTLYVCGGVTVFVSTITSNQTINQQILYSQEFAFVWMIAFAVVTILLTLEITKFMKKTEELSWNLLLTA